jgi:hypothetical protein
MRVVAVIILGKMNLNLQGITFLRAMIGEPESMGMIAK